MAGANMENTSALAEFKRGLELLRNGQAGEALEFLRRAAEREQHNPYYISFLGLCVARAERKFPAALQLCEEGVRAKPGETQLYLNLAEVYVGAGRRDEAVETLDKALRYCKPDQRISRARSRLGKRGSPMLPFLARENVLNRGLGSLRHRALQRLRRSDKERKNSLISPGVPVTRSSFLLIALSFGLLTASAGPQAPAPPAVAPQAPLPRLSATPQAPRAVPPAKPPAAIRTAITGQVLNADGKAARGAWISLQASDGRQPRTVQADAEGRFTFPLASGMYDLRARAGGRISEWHRNVRVIRGRHTNIALRLPPSSSPIPKTAMIPASLPHPANSSSPDSNAK
jgi:tetratricopeptide (TPR) repeat protein